MRHATPEPDPTPAQAPPPSSIAGTVAAAKPRRWRSPRRIVAGGVAVMALVAGGTAVAASQRSSASGYRTATVGSHAVTQTLDGVATIEPVSQATIAFPVAGTVSSVAAKVGDTVTTGQTLATLETDSLAASLTDARAALDQAELRLEKALAGEDVGGVGGSGGSGSDGRDASAAGVSLDTTATTTPIVATVAYSPTPSSGEHDGRLQAAQQAVLAAQKKVDAALRTARQALGSATQVCAAVGEDDDPSTTSTPSTPSSSDGEADITACQDALRAVLVAQRAVADQQDALAEAAAGLDALLAQQAANSTATPSTPSDQSDRTPSSSVPSTGSVGSTSPSSADLIAYQKAVDAAAVKVAVAEQAVRQATIVSPISGTVASVGITAGDEVTAASTTAHVVVVGAGGYEVTTMVGVDDLRDVKVGQAASIVPDGTTAAIAGEVVSIGVAADTSGSTPTYPVVIGLADRSDGDGLRNGAIASVSITTDAASDALAVPTSAITTAGTRHTVTVLAGGKTERVAVQVGAIGSTWTEITGGLEAGQVVVLADLGTPLPGSATDRSNGTNGRRGNGGGPVIFGGPQFGGRKPGG